MHHTPSVCTDEYLCSQCFSWSQTIRRYIGLLVGHGGSVIGSVLCVRTVAGSNQTPALNIAVVTLYRSSEISSCNHDNPTTVEHHLKPSINIEAHFLKTNGGRAEFTQIVRCLAIGSPIMERGDSAVGSVPCVQKVAGSNPTLPAT